MKDECPIIRALLQCAFQDPDCKFQLPIRYIASIYSFVSPSIQTNSRFFIYRWYLNCLHKHTRPCRNHHQQSTPCVALDLHHQPHPNSTIGPTVTSPHFPIPGKSLIDPRMSPRDCEKLRLSATGSTTLEPTWSGQNESLQ